MVAGGNGERGQCSEVSTPSELADKTDFQMSTVQSLRWDGLGLLRVDHRKLLGGSNVAQSFVGANSARPCRFFRSSATASCSASSVRKLELTPFRRTSRSASCK